MVLAATWRRLQGRLRPDLLSRFSQYVITVPSLAEREADLDRILIDVEQECLQTYQARLDRLSKTPDADQDYWEQQKRTAVGLSQTDREQLRRVDWGRHGNLRGLTGAVERIVVGGRSAESRIRRRSLATGRSPPTFWCYIVHGTQPLLRRTRVLLLAELRRGRSLRTEYTLLASPAMHVELSSVRVLAAPHSLWEAHRLGLRFRVDWRLPGTRRRADMAFTRWRIAVFVDGCFWHGCPVHGTWPKANARWWREKILANVRRDQNTTRDLETAGWQVLRFWEHDDMRAAAIVIATRLRRASKC